MRVICVKGKKNPPHAFWFGGPGLGGALYEVVRGELPIGREYRVANLYAVGRTTTSTMMQSCASAAKLQGGGPIPPCGSNTMR